MENLKRLIYVVLIITILGVPNIGANAQVDTSVPPFKDVKLTDWYCTAVFRLMIYDITSGYSDKTFKPQNSVSRAEFVTFLCRVDRLAMEEGSPYSDTKNHWASGWINAALKANIIDKDIKFYPNRAITRQEAVEMLCRAVSLGEDNIMVTPYADVKTDIGYSNTAYEEYLMRGSVTDNKRYFNPSGVLKRCEAAKILSDLLYYREDPEKYKAAKKAEPTKEQAVEIAKTEAKRYAEWQESVKDIPAEVLKNTDGICKLSEYTGNIIRGSVYDSYKYLRDDGDNIKEFGDFCNMSSSEMIKEMVKVGSNYANIYANANYKKIDTFESNLKSLFSTDDTTNYVQKNVDIVKNNKIVREGKFITSEGMLVANQGCRPVLRGTVRYRYLSPTSTTLLKSEIVSSTKKPSQLGVLYEQDFEVGFSVGLNGLKIDNFFAISDIRLSK